MNSEHLSRRKFLERTALAAGAVAFGTTAMGQEAAGAAAAAGNTAAATATAAAKRTVSDQVALGNTGLKVSRLGLGLGTSNGQIQAALGQEGFNALIKHAFDQGITLYDTAQAYRTLTMMAPAIKGLPREKIFIQSKIERPENILTVIDNQRKTFNTDYIDSLLVHIQVRADWTETWKRAMEEFDTARQRQWIKSKGVSCHTLPALRTSITSDWTQVHLVRVNPQGLNIDTEQQFSRGGADVNPVVAEIKKMKEKQRGVIGMKIFANGALRTEAERERSAKFAMSLKEIDAVVIGFANINELDQGIKLFNKVLAEAA